MSDDAPAPRAGKVAPPPVIVKGAPAAVVREEAPPVAHDGAPSALHDGAKAHRNVDGDGGACSLELPTVAGSFPRKRKSRAAKLRNSMRLGLVLAALTGVNVYVFCFHESTSVKKLMAPSSTSAVLPDQRDDAIEGAAEAVIKAPAAKPSARAARSAKANAVNAVVPTRDPATTAGQAAVAVAHDVPAPAARVPSFAAPSTGPVGAAGVGTQVMGAPAGDSDGHQDPRQIEGKIGAMDTLGTVLVRENFGAQSSKVVAALSKLVDPRQIRAGEGYAVELDETGAPQSFEYRPTPVLRMLVTRDDAGAWSARKDEKPLETRTESAAGVVESSLYESVHKAGESSALVSLIVDLFAWDINFYIDTHPGDTWKVVIEKQYLGGQLYKYGRLLAAEYSGSVGTYRAFYFAPGPKAPGRYYDDKGQSVAKTLLKCPLRFVRVSSKFDPKRFHPVLHTIKAHLGVDYAAPVGTPVWASANGKVAECQMKRGSGNTIVLNHGNGLATRYYHLSRFAPGLRVGQQVKQKQIIGFVGTTGLSTGPHLHFGLTKNGAFVDPFKMKLDREAPVPNRPAFFAAIRAQQASLKALAPALAKSP